MTKLDITLKCFNTLFLFLITIAAFKLIGIFQSIESILAQFLNVL
ncbi:hypothetical protein [Metabacillus fastidiosus]|uniref:Uncharacterized protein n=1 Tax=Metabacillus fastidiosus TaxID=1458 RepID=A0ABU6P0F7_9BACI|nr:hypothetical protein [Metabacillus fastidiosus]MED4402122.1 hypothetical protein [Metabacillus fastidiosus]